MKTQTLCLGSLTLRFRQGEAWSDGELEISPHAGAPVRIAGAQAVLALRDFLDCLDFSGRRLTLLARPSPDLAGEGDRPAAVPLALVPRAAAEPPQPAARRMTLVGSGEA